MNISDVMGFGKSLGQAEQSVHPLPKLTILQLILVGRILNEVTLGKSNCVEPEGPLVRNHPLQVVKCVLSLVDKGQNGTLQGNSLILCRCGLLGWRLHFRFN